MRLGGVRRSPSGRSPHRSEIRPRVTRELARLVPGVRRLSVSFELARSEAEGMRRAGASSKARATLCQLRPAPRTARVTSAVRSGGAPPRPTVRTNGLRGERATTPKNVVEDRRSGQCVGAQQERKGTEYPAARDMPPPLVRGSRGQTGRPVGEKGRSYACFGDACVDRGLGLAAPSKETLRSFRSST